jgi:hypothetical protein
MLTNLPRKGLRTIVQYRPALSKRFKATISDIEIDQRHGHGLGEPYKMEYKFGMPTPPLSPKLGQKSESSTGERLSSRDQVSLHILISLWNRTCKGSSTILVSYLRLS